MAVLKKRLFHGLAGFGLLTLLVITTPLVEWWASWLSAGYSDEPRPVLVILSGDLFSDTVVGYSTYLRCMSAFWFWQRHDTPELVVSGGPPERPIAQAMASVLISFGVPAGRIQLETAPKNTREDLTYLARRLRNDSRPVTLLTSDYHMRRAMRLAHRYGLQPAPHPIADVIKRTQNWSERPGLAVLLAVETGKLAYEASYDFFHPLRVER